VFVDLFEKKTKYSPKINFCVLCQVLPMFKNHLLTPNGTPCDEGPFFLIPGDVAPRFIGKKGVLIKEIKSKSDCHRIDVDYFPNRNCGVTF
jgi:hypothetical protein